MLYLYLVGVILTFAGSSGARLPRLLIAAFWLPMLAAFVLFLLISLSVLWTDNWVSFGPARRALGQLGRAIRYFRRAGAGA
jgi:hypothetical protein